MVKGKRRINYPKTRRKSIVHTVHTKHPRYNTSSYSRGSRQTTQQTTPPSRKWARDDWWEHGDVKRYLNTPEGDIISIVTGNVNVSKRNRLGIDGEMRVVIGTEAFSIPVSLRVVSRKSDTEIIRIAERRYDDIQRHKKSSSSKTKIDLKKVKTYRGNSYFPTSAMAQDYALEHGLPTHRIIHYKRGYAIQKKKSGAYWDVKKKQWS